MSGIPGELHETWGGEELEQHFTAYRYYSKNEAKALLDRKLPRTEQMIRELKEATAKQGEPVLTDDQRDGLKLLRLAESIARFYPEIFDLKTGGQELINMTYAKICLPDEEEKIRQIPRGVRFTTAVYKIMRSIAGNEMKKVVRDRKKIKDLAFRHQEDPRLNVHGSDDNEWLHLYKKMLSFAATVDDTAERLLLEGWLMNKIEVHAKPHEIAAFLGQDAPNIEMPSLIARLRRHIRKEFSVNGLESK